MRKLLIGAVTVLVLALGGYWLFIDTIVGNVIEDGARGALGVEARVGLTRLGLLSGELRLNNVRIGNPPGFEEPYFVGVKTLGIEGDPRLLWDPVVEIPRISLEGVDVSLERQGDKTNYGTILENMDSFEGADAARDESTEGRRFVVRRLLIRDVNARVEWSRVAAKQTKLELKIPEIELRDLGEGGGLTSAELTNLITKAILGSIYRHGAGLPGEVASGLGSGLRGLGNVSGVVVRGADKTVGGVAGAAGRALEGLFGKGKDEE